MAGTVDEKWSIDKLESLNWITQKSQMRHLLMAKGLWGLVDCTEVPAEGANAQTQLDFRKRKAFCSIVMAISTPQLYLLPPVSNQRKPGMPCATISSVRHWQTNYF